MVISILASEDAGCANRLRRRSLAPHAQGTCLRLPPTSSEAPLSNRIVATIRLLGQGWTTHSSCHYDDWFVEHTARRRHNSGGLKWLKSQLKHPARPWSELWCHRMRTIFVNSWQKSGTHGTSAAADFWQLRQRWTRTNYMYVARPRWDTCAAMIDVTETGQVWLTAAETYCRHEARYVGDATVLHCRNRSVITDC